MDSIAGFMSSDHNRLDALFRRFQETRRAGPEAAGGIFADFRSGLLRHIAWEEELLFPRFEDRTGMLHAGPTVVMRMEHRRIKEFLEGIGARLAAGDARTGEQEGGLVAVLSEHNRKEEAVLYPWLDRSLAEGEAREVLEAMKSGPPG